MTGSVNLRKKYRVCSIVSNIAGKFFLIIGIANFETFKCLRINGFSLFCYFKYNFNVYFVFNSAVYLKAQAFLASNSSPMTASSRVKVFKMSSSISRPRTPILRCSLTVRAGGCWTKGESDTLIASLTLTMV